MDISPYKPKELFLNLFTPELLKAITKAVVDGYKEAFDYCSGNFDEYQVHDLLPHMRKAVIERNILHCVKRFPYARAKTASNQLKNCYHALVSCGHAILTISSVNTPNQMVREAIFRKQYARDGQISFFVKEEPIIKLHNNLYAILLHSSNKYDPSKPSFVMINFPDASLKKYLDQPVNLTGFHKGNEQEIIQKPAVGTRSIAKTGDGEK